MPYADDFASLVVAVSIAVSTFVLWRIAKRLLDMWSRMETLLHEANLSGCASKNPHDPLASGKTDLG
jgi:hypothetical protein